jgi:hypothetical protein
MITAIGVNVTGYLASCTTWPTEGSESGYLVSRSQT